MSIPPVGSGPIARSEDLAPPDRNTVAKLQQLIGIAWTDWDEADMRSPTLQFLEDIAATTADERQSKAEAQRLISDFWGEAEQLEELSNLLVAWAEGNFHATSFDASAGTDGRPAEAGSTVPIVELPTANGESVAICVGHTISGLGSGAVNQFATEQNEQKWNTEIALRLHELLTRQGAASRIYYRTDGNYSTFVAKQREEITREQPGCACAVELHFNSATPAAHGCEFLCYSNNGTRLARAMANAYTTEFPDMTMRRDNGVLKRSSGNGVGWLKNVPPPAVIAEPFFASNEQEALFFDAHKDELASAYAAGILNFLNSSR